MKRRSTRSCTFVRAGRKAIAATSVAPAVTHADPLLRYRLYDVDVLINRTVVYGTVTVVLATAYGATAVLLGLAMAAAIGRAVKANAASISAAGVTYQSTKLVGSAIPARVAANTNHFSC